MPADIDGVLVIDKPPGMTSHDVVDVVRKRLGTRRVGHAGTLDPDATGLLIVGVGRATRFLSYAQAAPKSYRARARFGVTTTTQDASGEIVEERPVDLDADAIRDALADFVGHIEQVPPMVSAVKVGGERLYAKARRGEDVAREPRPVTVHTFELTDFSVDPPEASFDVTCSAGTYVRTLVHDLGQRLGCGAHLLELRRTATGSFAEADAVPLDDVDARALRRVADLVRELPAVHAEGPVLDDVAHGRSLAIDGIEEASEIPDGGAAAVVLEGRLLAVYRRAGDRLVADKVVGQ